MGWWGCSAQFRGSRTAVTALGMGTWHGRRGADLGCERPVIRASEWSRRSLP